MRMPRGPKLDRLIRFPVEWNQFYLRMEEERRLPELLEALEELPESSVRDVRIARIQVRFGKIKDAKERLYQHKRCPLARSLYFSLLMKIADEDTRRKFVENFKPAGSIGGSILNLEARYNEFMTMASALQIMNRVKQANEMYFEALNLAKVMKDHNAERIVVYNMAWMRLYNGQLKESRSTFEHVLRMTKPSMVIYEYAMEYISWISWMTNDIPDYLPTWARQSIAVLKGGDSIPKNFDYPSSAGLPVMIALLKDLRELTKEFYLKIPLMHVEENRIARDKLVEKIKSNIRENSGEIMGFMCNCMLALSLSMQHNKEAFRVLKDGFQWPSTGVPLMGMLYHANLIQVQANLPHVAVDKTEIARALDILSNQWQHLSATEQDWLLSWMKDFNPVTLYLISEKYNLYPQPHDYVIVQKKGVYRGTETVAKYPRLFMVRYIQELLAGGKVPDNNRKQAYRHFEALQAEGSPLVIYEPVLEPFRQLMD